MGVPQLSPAHRLLSNTTSNMKSAIIAVMVLAYCNMVTCRACCYERQQSGQQQQQLQRDQNGFYEKQYVIGVAEEGNPYVNGGRGGYVYGRNQGYSNTGGRYGNGGYVHTDWSYDDDSLRSIHVACCYQHFLQIC